MEKNYIKHERRYDVGKRMKTPFHQLFQIGLHHSHSSFHSAISYTAAGCEQRLFARQFV
ncbi:uncharacterized protein DS421_7g217430 [Arachis hypogaea]|nr:uncharacterized protein DS421_7g217430 [Arachis hypogaea]